MKDKKGCRPASYSVAAVFFISVKTCFVEGQEEGIYLTVRYETTETSTCGEFSVDLSRCDT